MTSFQRDYYRRNSRIFIEDIKRQVDKYLQINDINVYHVQDYLRKMYQRNNYLRYGMSYPEYIEQVFSNYSMKPEYRDIIVRDVDYGVSARVNPSIFFY